LIYQMIQMISMKEVIILILQKKNIPVVFFFSGTHEDYHGPGDTADKIRYDLLSKRARLIFHIGWELANMDEEKLD
jgi:hypothetical protein